MQTESLKSFRSFGSAANKFLLLKKAVKPKLETSFAMLHFCFLGKVNNEVIKLNTAQMASQFLAFRKHLATGLNIGLEPLALAGLVRFAPTVPSPSRFASAYETS